MERSKGCKCSVYRCRNYYSTSVRLSFFRFPNPQVTSPEEIEKWKIACQNPKLSNNLKALYNNRRVCNIHFPESAIRKNRIVPGYIPTLCLFQLTPVQHDHNYSLESNEISSNDFDKDKKEKLEIYTPQESRSRNSPIDFDQTEPFQEIYLKHFLDYEDVEIPLVEENRREHASVGGQEELTSRKRPHQKISEMSPQEKKLQREISDLKLKLEDMETELRLLQKGS